MKTNANRFNENEVRDMLHQLSRETKLILLEFLENLLAAQEAAKGRKYTRRINAQKIPAAGTKYAEITPAMINGLTADEKRQLYISILLLKDISAAKVDEDLPAYADILCEDQFTAPATGGAA